MHHGKLAVVAATGSLCIGLSLPAAGYDLTSRGSLLYPNTQVHHYTDGVPDPVQPGRMSVDQGPGAHRHDWTLTTISGTGTMQRVASSLTEKQCMLRAKAEVDVAACRPVGGPNGTEICEDQPLAPTAACGEQ